MGKVGTTRVVLLAVLGAAVVAWIGTRLWAGMPPAAQAALDTARAALVAGGTPRPVSAARAAHRHATPGAPSPALDAFMAQVIKVSAMDDPLQRCLQMPDPPDSHWHTEGVQAYCRTRFDPTLLTSTRFREMILHGQGAAVDALFDGYLASQLKDPAHAGRFDAALYRAGFREDSSTMRAAINVWKRQRPDSPFAFAASGMQYASAAFTARGSGWAREVTPAQWQTAHELARLGHDDLKRAAELRPEMPTVYGDMLSIGVLVGADDYAGKSLQRGLAVDRNDMVLRLQQIALTGPRWGGEADTLRKLNTELTAAAPAAPLLWVAAGRAHIRDVTQEGDLAPRDGNFLGVASEVATATDLGNLADDARREGRYDDALILSVEALRFDNSMTRALYIVGWLGWSGQYPEWAKATLQRAAADNPESGPVASYAGSWLRHLGDKATAERLLLYAKDHDPDNDWALSTLGDFYSHEGKDYGKAQVIAEELIRRNPSNANGYVIQACVQMDTNHPDRFKTLHAFLDRWGNDPEQQKPSGQMRAYLAAHEGKGET